MSIFSLEYMYIGMCYLVIYFKKYHKYCFLYKLLDIVYKDYNASKYCLSRENEK